MRAGQGLGCVWTRLTYDRMYFTVNVVLFDLRCVLTLKPVYVRNRFCSESSVSINYLGEYFS